MKVHFSNVNFSSCSGPNTFAYRLANKLTERGYEIVSQNFNYDIFLCFIEPTSTPRNGCKFIHRLDGIWFKPEQYETHNRNIKWAYDNADHVIWQSQFDKNMTLKYWGTPKQGSVVHNGIERISLNYLHPDIQKIKDTYDKIFVCSASWHRQKRLKENIEFYIKNRSKNDVLLVLGSNPDFIVNRADILYLGQLSHDRCLQIYSTANWFLHLAWLDHCPNVVVEALSQGCPVICTDSGGTKETVGENGVIIKESNQYNFELTDYDSPYNLEINKINLPNIIVKNSHLDIRLICDDYEEIFTK